MLDGENSSYVTEKKRRYTSSVASRLKDIEVPIFAKAGQPRLDDHFRLHGKSLALLFSLSAAGESTAFPFGKPVRQPLSHSGLMIVILKQSDLSEQKQP